MSQTKMSKDFPVTKTIAILLGLSLAGCDLDSGSSAGITDQPILLPLAANAGSDQILRLGQATSLDASLSSGGEGDIASWSWVDDENVLIGTTESVTFTPSSAGQHTVTLTTTNDLGETDTDDLVVLAQDITVTCNNVNNSSDCVEVTHRLDATTIEAGAEFGVKLSLSGDRLLVGAFREDTNGLSAAGAAYIFDRDENGAWVSSAKLVASDAGSGDFFGFGVDLDGDTAIIGAFNHDPTPTNTSAGAAYIFERQSSGDWIQVQKLSPTDLIAGNEFGISVSISNDLALVGASSMQAEPALSGSAYVFENVGNSWLQTDRLLPTDGSPGDHYGIEVDLQDNRAVVGSRGANGIDGTATAGTVYVHELNSDGTDSSVTRLGASVPIVSHQFGRGLSLDGDLLLIGAYGDSGDGSTPNGGAAYLFSFEGGSWVEVQKITPSSVNTDDRFGRRLALSNNRAVIGAGRSDIVGVDSGIAYVYQPDASGQWIETQSLAGLNRGAGDFFGVSIALSEQHVVVGANNESGVSDETPSSGAAYVFTN